MDPITRSVEMDASGTAFSVPVLLLDIGARTTSACVLALLLAAGATPVPEKPSYTSTPYGFRIEAPHDDWIVQGGGEGEKGGARVTLASPKLAEGLVVTVHAVEAAGAPTPELARQQDLDFMQGKPLFSTPRSFDMHIAGEPSKAMEFLYHEATAGDFLVRKFQLAHAEIRYTIEVYAPAKGFDAWEKELDSILDSFMFVEVTKAEREKRGWESLALKCGSEIEWAKDWSDAARRARKEGKLILVSANLIQGFALADQAQTGTFMDPDIVALAQERFVCWKLARGDDAPFRSQDSYGMGPNAFGVALLIVSPEGEVLEQTEQLQTQIADRFLRDGLERHRQLQKDSGTFAGTPLEQAEKLGRRGEFEPASKMLAESTSAGAYLLRASFERREGRGAEALAAVELAAKADDAAAFEARIDHERGRILGGSGRVEEAAACFARRIARDADDTAAHFQRAACALVLGKKEDARSGWEKLAREHPEDRWAWAAAAELTSFALDMEVTWNLRFFEPELLRALRTPEAHALPLDRAREARADAVAFLLREQRADGSWTSPTEIRIYETERPDPFPVANTALAGEALLGGTPDERARAAAERALDFLLESIARSKETGDSPGFMDYEVWSYSMALRFFARCSETKVGQREDLRRAAKWLVSELRRKLRPGGGWSYYLTTDVTDKNPQDQQSISFVVGAVTLALQRAEETKLADAKELVAGGLGCLERMRGGDGVFAYMLGAEAAAPRETAKPAGDAGRGPGCELALFRGKRSDAVRLARALELFREHAASLLRERGKVLMHCGPEGQGCHYILFDLWTASLAVHELPEKQRAPYRTLLVESLMQLRSKEGGFRDTPILGWNCGTAMAVLALDALQPSP